MKGKEGETRDEVCYPVSLLFMFLYGEKGEREWKGKREEREGNGEGKKSGGRIRKGKRKKGGKG